MASAFVSYAHEDQEFVLALYDQLRSKGGVDVRYDAVALRIGTPSYRLSRKRSTRAIS